MRTQQLQTALSRVRHFPSYVSFGTVKSLHRSRVKLIRVFVVGSNLFKFLFEVVDVVIPDFNFFPSFLHCFIPDKFFFLDSRKVFLMLFCPLYSELLNIRKISF